MLISPNEQVVRSYTRKMRELDDDYFRERAADFLDVSRRVLRNLQGKAQAELQQPRHALPSSWRTISRPPTRRGSTASSCSAW